MVIFHGLALSEVAPARIVDVKVSSIAAAVTVRDRTLKDGAYFIRRRGESRTVTITFAVLEQGKNQRTEHIQRIRQWGTTAQPEKLIVPQRADQYLMALCAELPEASGKEWWEELTMTFTAYDPYFVDAAEKVAPCGLPFGVVGTAPPRIVLRATLASAVNNPIWVLDGAKTLSLHGSVGPGTLEVDFNNQTITLNGASIMSKYAFGSTFFDIGPGIHTVAGYGALYWRERWQ